MPYSAIVMTAGISLFGQRNHYGKWTREQGLFRFEQTNPLPLEGATEEAALEQWKGAIQHLQLHAHEQDPASVSAEYSLLLRLQQQNRLGPIIQVELLYTETLGGTAAALLLQRLLEQDFNAAVTLRQWGDVDVDSPSGLSASLGQFMHEVVSALDGHDASYTCFAPICGYKVMTSLGYLAGSWRGFSTVYLHEDQQVLHEIPAIPIRVDPDAVQAVAPLVQRVGDGCELEDLDEDEGNKLDEHSWLFEQSDGLVMVNAIGQFLRSLPEHAHLFSPRILVAEQVLGQGGHRKLVLKQLASLANKLAAGSNEADLHHQWFTTGAGWDLYKGSSNGQIAFRAVYSFVENGGCGELRVAHLWTDHDRYEREAKDRCATVAEVDLDWTDWTEQVYPPS